MATQIQTVAAAARSSSKWNRQRPRVWSGTRIASGASSVASSSTWTITRATRARFTVSHTSRNSSNRNRLKSPTSLVSRSHRAVSRATRDLLESMPVQSQAELALKQPTRSLISANLSGRFDNLLVVFNGPFNPLSVYVECTRHGEKKLNCKIQVKKNYIHICNFSAFQNISKKICT